VSITLSCDVWCLTEEIKDEFIVRPGHRMPDAEAKSIQAPEPLLPNYGEGRLRQYTLDMDMMIMLNSKERTLDDFIALGDTAGLKFVKLWEAGEMGLIEFESLIAVV
jgi:hypothetical protein